MASLEGFPKPAPKPYTRPRTLNSEPYTLNPRPYKGTSKISGALYPLNDPLKEPYNYPLKETL